MLAEESVAVCIFMMVQLCCAVLCCAVLVSDQSFTKLARLAYPSGGLQTSRKGASPGTKASFPLRNDDSADAVHGRLNIFHQCTQLLVLRTLSTQWLHHVTKKQMCGA